MAHVYEKAAELVEPKLAGDGECVALVTIYTSVGPTAIWRPKKSRRRPEYPRRNRHCNFRERPLPEPITPSCKAGNVRRRSNSRSGRCAAVNQPRCHRPAQRIADHQLVGVQHIVERQHTLFGAYCRIVE